MATREIERRTASVSETETLRARVSHLEALCADAYQLAGAVGAPERFLDALWAAAQGEEVPAGDRLPISAVECDEVRSREALLDDLRKLLGISAASELGRKGGSQTSEAKQAAARKNGRRGGRPASLVKQYARYKKARAAYESSPSAGRVFSQAGIWLMTEFGVQTAADPDGQILTIPKDQLNQVDIVALLRLHWMQKDDVTMLMTALRQSRDWWHKGRAAGDSEDPGATG